MVTLPWKLGGIIRDSIDAYRIENNIPEPDEVKALGVHKRRDTFMEEEFELVRNITIDKDTLEYIDLFPNIISITINGNAELNNLQIKSLLDKYPKLETLIIKGQEQLQFLDLNNLTKLKHLELISNRGLHRIVGLDIIDDLENLTFYDNSTYSNENELCTVISELTKKGTHCDLDVLYMPTMIQIGIPNPENYNWCESVGLGIYGDELKYETKELEQAVEKAKEIVSKYIKSSDTALQKYAILYQWMCENIRYDNDADKGKTVGKFGGTNGTVNGLVYGSCVCEGYSKSMQMLLKLCKIPSFDISCIAEDPKKVMTSWNIDGKKRMHEGDHSILKVNIDGMCYYSDVTWDANRFQHNVQRKFFLLSKEDILKDHKLVRENDVLSASQSISNQEFQELIKFAQERIRTVNKQMEEKIKMDKTPKEKLQEIEKKLEDLRKEYGNIAKKIQDLMIKNQQTPIVDYVTQLNLLTSRRDMINQNMNILYTSKRSIERTIDIEREIKHKNAIAQVEKLLGIHIRADIGSIYDPELHVPRLVLKDTAILSKERLNIQRKLEQLYNDDKIDLKTYNSMKLEVTIEYDSMQKKAPKPAPAQPQSSDESTYTQKQEQTPMTAQTQPSVTSTNNQQQEQNPLSVEPLYMSTNKKSNTQKRKEKTDKKEEKEQLEEERRELRRKQFQERAKAMGLDLNEVTNLDDIFRQQQMIEQQTIEETEKLEEDHGMMM